MKCKTCPIRKHCFDYGNCDGCDYGVYIIKLLRKIERLKKENTRLKEKRERRGTWEPRSDMIGYVRCSACKDCNIWDEWADGKKWRYCPHCGAKMEREEEPKQ